MRTHSADDIIVVCKVSLAVLAAEDLVGSEVDVVRETHDGGGCCYTDGRTAWRMAEIGSVKASGRR